MPKGPRGEKRPADVIGAAVLVGRIATGEVEERLPPKASRVEVASKGGAARAVVISKSRRTEIARAGAAARRRASSDVEPQTD